ncbi:MAG: molybdopterin-dependent oxidoreductase, partial [Candidatus Cloacimonetes bacterium]|nr:molybdopterin-dependent oxidoreductase [Candidatus Cloacimonadota bacterium]
KRKLQAGEIKAMLVFGENPLIEGNSLLDGVEFLVVSDMLPTETTAEADVVLPLSPAVESCGSYTTFDGVVQTVKPVLETKSGKSNCQIIAELANEFGVSMNIENCDTLRKEIAAVSRIHEIIDSSLYCRQMKMKDKRIPPTAHLRFSSCKLDIATTKTRTTSVLACEQYYKTKIRQRL